MNKVVSVNLGGRVFNIDEPAYQQLNEYLEILKLHFKNEEGRDEIIADIEARIGEMFFEKLRNKREIVALHDVDEVIAVMGRPEEVAGADINEEGATEEEKKTFKTGKRVYRHPDDKILGGVCGGISAYFGIDPIWLRLIFALALVIYGTGILLYIILWVIIPEAKTPTQRLEMKGENVTVSNIEKTVKEEFENLKKKVDSWGKEEWSKVDFKGKFGEAGRALEKVLNFFIQVLQHTLHFIGKLIGLILIIAGILAIIVLAAAFLAGAGIISSDASFLLPLFFDTKAQILFALIGVALLVGAPLIYMMTKGIQLLFKIKPSPGRAAGWSTFALSATGLFILIFIGVQVVKDYKTKALSEQTQIIETSSDTLYLDVIKEYDEELRQQSDNLMQIRLDDRIFFVESENKIAVGEIYLNIKKSTTPEFRLVQKVSARGQTQREAHETAQNISYQVRQQDSLLKFSPAIFLNKDEKWRAQKIYLTLEVPEGKAVYLNPAMSGVIYDIENVSNTWDRDMLGHTWTMTGQGLTCIGCDLSEVYIDAASDHISKTYQLSDFNKTDIGNSFDISINRGENYLITVKGQKKDLKELDVKKQGSKLIVELDKDWRNIFQDREKMYVNITMPELTGIDIGGACKAYITGFSTPELDVEISGASACSIKDIKSDVITSEVSGASSLILAGEAGLLKATLNGASDLKAFDLKVRKAALELNGSSDAEIHVTEELKADLHGASDLIYIGNPVVNSNTYGASSIKAKKD